MEIMKNRNIDFLRYKIPALFLSLVIILAGLALVWQKGLNYGVDFSGGTAIHLKFRRPIPLDQIRSALEQAGYRDSAVQAFNDPSQVLIRLPQQISSEAEIEQISQKVLRILQATALKSSPPGGREDLNGASLSDLRAYILMKDPWGVKSADKYAGELQKLNNLKQANTGLFPPFEQMRGIDSRIINSLKENYYVSDLAMLSTEYVGPQVGSELREQARLAIIWSLAGLLIYVWFRFEFLWGFSAVVCLAHDVLITLAFFAFTGREISLTVIAAFLTIVGFSLNDTIVIYDRVRDNLKSMRSQSLESVINLSLNQMLNRTILTNGTVITVTIVLYLFGGEVINDFAFAMLVGGISGTYSTIYIASALIVLYQKYFGKKKKAGAVKARVSQKVS